MIIFKTTFNLKKMLVISLFNFMLNVLWLCSWYPNEIDEFRGDFIKRQAIATAQYCKIDVVHVVLCNENKTSKNIINENLTENIFYIKKKHKFFDYYKMNSLVLNFSKNNNYQLLHIQIPMPIGLTGLIIKKRLQIPLVVSEHYGIYNNIVEDNYSTRSFIFKFFTKKIFQQAKQLITVSHQLGKDIQQVVLQKKFVVIPNVVNTDIFYFQEKSEINKFRFVHVSNMLTVKNIEGILHAIKILSLERDDFEFYFLGAKPNKYLSLAENLHLLNKIVFFKGEMPYFEIAKKVVQSDAGVLFSFSESQSCVVLEWLCAGLPVITSKVGGVTELISVENGLLIESNNIQQLANAMNEIITNKSKYNSTEISKKAIQEFCYKSVGKKINDIYVSLIQ